MLAATKDRSISFVTVGEVHPVYKHRNIFFSKSATRKTLLTVDQDPATSLLTKTDEKLGVIAIFTWRSIGRAVRPNVG